jgi:hypothetical protein
VKPAERLAFTLPCTVLGAIAGGVWVITTWKVEAPGLALLPMSLGFTIGVLIDHWRERRSKRSSEHRGRMTKGK